MPVYYGHRVLYDVTSFKDDPLLGRFNQGHQLGKRFNEESGEEDDEEESEEMKS